jgi:arsenate reductase-like glutaredoxin family protein
VRAWLSQQSVALEQRDFFRERFSEDELRGLLGVRPVSDFFSWTSPSFRKLGLERDSLDDDQLVAMMLDEPRLIRRPLIVVNGVLLAPMSGSERIVALLEQKTRARRG